MSASETAANNRATREELAKVSGTIDPAAEILMLRFMLSSAHEREWVFEGLYDSEKAQREQAEHTVNQLRRHIKLMWDFLDRADPELAELMERRLEWMTHGSEAQYAPAGSY